MTKQIIEVRNHTNFTVKKIERVVKNVVTDSIESRGEVSYKGVLYFAYTDTCDGMWVIDIQ